MDVTGGGAAAAAASAEGAAAAPEEEEEAAAEEDDDRARKAATRAMTTHDDGRDTDACSTWALVRASMAGGGALEQRRRPQATMGDLEAAPRNKHRNGAPRNSHTSNGSLLLRCRSDVVDSNVAPPLL